MIPRYTRPDMGRIWSDENRFRTWLAVEVAATETLAEAGIVPKDAAKAIRERADFNLDRIHEIEAEVRHDVIAFTTAVAEIVGPHARWFHYGLTSNDVVDTAQALLIQQASAIIAADLEKLSDVLERRAWEFKDTPMIGRTHGIHAEPITFGFKLANWYSETQRNIARFRGAAEDMRVGKFSGAVGTFAHLSPELEEKHLRAPGTESRRRFVAGDPARPPRGLSRHAGRDRLHARQDCHRNPPPAAHRGARGRRSSSAKSRRARPPCRTSATRSRWSRSAAWPAWCARTRRPAFENVALWHERDISHSSVERVIIPDSTTLVDYLLQKTTNVIDTMFVYPGAHAGESGEHRAAWCSADSFCSTWWSTASRARMPIAWCRTTPCGPGKKA